MGLVIAALGVVAGPASRRRVAPGLTVIVAMGLVAGWCATLSPTFTTVDLVPPLASLVVGVAVFAALHRFQTCVSNEIGGYLMSTSMFLGAPLAELLAEAGVRPGPSSCSPPAWTATPPASRCLR